MTGPSVNRAGPRFPEPRPPAWRRLRLHARRTWWCASSVSDGICYPATTRIPVGVLPEIPVEVEDGKGVQLVENAPAGVGRPQAQAVRILGTIPASGVLVTDLRVPDLGPGDVEDNLFLQVWRNSPIDGRMAGGFAALTVLDASL